jgi:hypothetical protein
MGTERIKLNIKPIWKAKRGHPTTLSGSGTHKDRRTKRKRTRAARNKSAMKDWD